MIIIMERTEGLLDRTWIAGVTPGEFALAHFLVSLVVNLLQVTVTLVFMILIFQVSEVYYIFFVFFTHILLSLYFFFVLNLVLSLLIFHLVLQFWFNIAWNWWSYFLKKLSPLYLSVTQLTSKLYKSTIMFLSFFLAYRGSWPARAFFLLFCNRRYSFLSVCGPQLYNLEALPFTYNQYVVIELADKLFNSVTVCFLCESMNFHPDKQLF